MEWFDGFIIMCNRHAACINQFKAFNMIHNMHDRCLNPQYASNIKYYINPTPSIHCIGSMYLTIYLLNAYVNVRWNSPQQWSFQHSNWVFEINASYICISILPIALGVGLYV